MRHNKLRDPLSSLQGDVNHDVEIAVHSQPLQGDFFPLLLKQQKLLRLQDYESRPTEFGNPGTIKDSLI